MAKILVTGGAVHAKLDAVKLITNQFRGRLMQNLALQLQALGNEVTYLTSEFYEPSDPRIRHRLHSGFDDYQRQVLELAPQFDMVVLGAAVANLIPTAPWSGKFPSHSYAEGDIVNIPFRIAPRIINQVKAVAPKTILVGFKLLDEKASYQELVKAAKRAQQDSGAHLIIGNRKGALGDKVILTAEENVVEKPLLTLASFLGAIGNSSFYSSNPLLIDPLCPSQETMAVWKSLVARYIERLSPNKTGKAFGSVAIRDQNSFWTTKRSITFDKFEHPMLCVGVDHDRKLVTGVGGSATKNAPLLDTIFEQRADVVAIVHTHEISQDMLMGPRMDYALPGTVQDSRRRIGAGIRQFEIEGHGRFYLLRKEDL